ncbi:uncharacterized protein UDID_03959 [Ustilago sp. UG-2017a]|nr:uncharacterized protein UDID_03959 [Ustilago sp. UG-2017a]
MVVTRRQASGDQQNSQGSAADTKGTKRQNDQVKSEEPEQQEQAADDDDAKAADTKTEDSEEPAPKKPKTSTAIKNSDVDSILEVQQSELESRSDALTWLHSPAAWTLAHPDIPDGKGEKDTAEEGGETVRTPPEPYENKRAGADAEGHLSFPNSDLTAFQTLLCAILLSKPISHQFGLRTIETLLNKPYYFRSAKDLIDAGNEGRRAGLWEARTRHKEKTAVQLGSLAEGIVSLCGEDTDSQDNLRPILDKALSQASNKDDSFEVAEQIKAVLTKEINGLGPSRVEIFLRRVQSQWGAVFPFADDRALIAAVKFDLISEGDLEKGKEHATKKLAEQVAEHVGFPIEDGKKEEDEEAECGRWWFVRTLDVLIGLDIEKKIDEAAKQAKG